MTVLEYIKQSMGLSFLHLFFDANPLFKNTRSFRSLSANIRPIAPILKRRDIQLAAPSFQLDKTMSTSASPWTNTVTGTRAAYSSEKSQATVPPPTAAQQTNASQSEPAGARYHGVMVQSQGVRLLIPRNTAVFHVMNHAFTRGLPNGNMQPWEFPTGLTVTDLFEALGVDTGVKEYQFTSHGSFVGKQRIMVGDIKAHERLDEMGWCAGRGFTTPPIWIEILA